MNGLLSCRMWAFRFIGMLFSACKSVVSDFKFLLTVFVMECKLNLGVVLGWQSFKICLNYEQEEKGLILLKCQNIL